MLPPGGQNQETDFFFTTFKQYSFLTVYFSLRSNKFKRGSTTYAVVLCGGDLVVSVLDKFVQYAIDFKAKLIETDCTLELMQIDDFDEKTSRISRSLILHEKLLSDHLPELALSLITDASIAVLTKVPLGQQSKDLKALQWQASFRTGIVTIKPRLLGLVGVTTMDLLRDSRIKSIDILVNDNVKYVGHLALIVDPTVAPRFEIVINLVGTSWDCKNHVKITNTIYCTQRYAKIFKLKDATVSFEKQYKERNNESKNMANQIFNNFYEDDQQLGVEDILFM